ncbi:MAG: DJ-1/PfpI family protein [Sandaracinus sp.]|nr:DJ-1/PfpI family protein [Myxococcales bacterium]MCB9618102.1 DJ-1/PfpI family protein [Sandaracinus sp.]MCB9635164.1 DJ-1/PfpI family protein [Sandaracinus sp.]
MEIVLFLFDGITALDVIGPYEVLSRLPGARARFVGKTPGPVRTDNGMLGLVADLGMDDVERADVLVIPGGPGTRRLVEDEAVLAWVRRLDGTTRYTTSVCTGSLVLAAAGLLEGAPATTHWAMLDELASLGARPVSERVVEDGKRLTAAGVSAGIDMALTLAARLTSEPVARAIQLGIEYDPAPPFDGGSVDKTPAPIVEMVRAALGK